MTNEIEPEFDPETCDAIEVAFHALVEIYVREHGEAPPLDLFRHMSDHAMLEVVTQRGLGMQ